jgi:hypothetical protein
MTVDDNKRYAIEELKKINIFLDFIELCEKDNYFCIERNDIEQGIRRCNKIIDAIFKLHNIDVNKEGL